MNLMRVSCQFAAWTALTSALLFLPRQATSLEIAYALALNPTEATYEPAPDQHSNDGNPVRITRSSPGRYSVSFGRVAETNSNVQVSMFGTDNGHCNVRSWSSGTVNVACFDAGNNPFDRMFSVLAIQSSAGDSPASISFAFLSPATPSSAYTTIPQYTFSRDPIIVRRGSAGTYTVTMRDILEAPSALVTTGYSSNAYCSGLARVGDDRLVLGCFSQQGIGMDSRASIMAIRAGLDGMSFASVTVHGSLDSPNSWSSDSSPQRVTRLQAGHYRITIGPEAENGGIVFASATFSNAYCHTESFGGGEATVLCHRDGARTDAAFSAVAFRNDTPGSRVVVERIAWTALLRSSMSQLKIRIHNYDATEGQSVTSLTTCNPCPLQYRALHEDASFVDYRVALEGAGTPFTTLFTPPAVFRDPFLFLFNDINLIAARITVETSTTGNRVTLNFPFESNGREVVAACHDHVWCVSGPPHGNNRPNAEINSLVIHLPFRISVGSDRPVQLEMLPATYDANIQRAGACQGNFFEFFCDIWEAMEDTTVESEIASGIGDSLNLFVERTAQVLDRLEAGVSEALCRLVTLRGFDCAAIRLLFVEDDGDITLVF